MTDCPQCSCNVILYIGKLGDHAAYQCRDCGWIWSVYEKPERKDS
jgi:uncharacterized Zn finger protein